MIELRSDTFTKPSPGMREAIARADVGDDMVGEDPTVNALEARMAELFGKPAAVFASSGTQSNQMGLWTHLGNGDELLIEATSHVANFEAGGAAVLSGATTRTIRGDFGRLDVEHLIGQVRGGNIHFAPSRLLSLENSTNHGGGRTYPLAQIERVCDWAHRQGLKTHLDGARIFNACLAAGYTPADMGLHFDTISVCFSKGLGCPMGSMLLGSEADIARARRARKIFGGALRQAGIPAAACMYALDHNIDRLRDDHSNAKLFAQGVAQIKGLSIDVDAVETNLVFFEIAPEVASAATLSAALRERGVNMNPCGGTHRMRAVTHLDVNDAQIREAVKILSDVVSELTALSAAA